MPLHSIDAEVRVCLLEVKMTKQHRLSMQHLELQCPPPTPTYEDNTAVIALVKANKITNRFHHIDIPHFYMQDE